MRSPGFTLLEMMVATFIMGVAVVGLMAEISTSMRNASLVTNRDRAALLARSKLNELMLEPGLPLATLEGGQFDPSLTGGVPGGWSARMTRFEMPPQPQVGDRVLDRVQLEIWWTDNGQRRTFTLYGYRTDVLRPDDVQP